MADEFKPSKLSSALHSSQRSGNSSAENQSFPAAEHLLHLTDRELFVRLGWFISIRWVAGVVALLLVLIAWHQFKIRLPIRQIVLTICALFFYNALFLMLVTDAYRRKRVSRRFVISCANAQIICDFVTLAVLMHYTGGVENYFLIFFICPMVVACELLPARYAYMHAALGALLINLVAWLEYAGVLNHVTFGEVLGSAGYKNTLVVTQFTVALSCLLFTAAFLGSSISERLSLIHI